MDGGPPEEVPGGLRPKDPDADGNAAATTTATSATASVSDAVTDRAGDRSLSYGRLYPEILRLIFLYLDPPDRGRAAQVCRDWRDVADDRIIWRNVEVKVRLPDVSPLLYSSLDRRGIGKIKVVSFKGGLRELLQALPGLTSLDLSDCYNITDSCITESFQKRLPSLVSLNLSWCSQVSDVSVARIAMLLVNLEYLYLVGCERITDEGMVFIAEKLSSLKFLEAKECEISNVALRHLAGIDRNIDGSKRSGVTSLEHLGLEDCALVSDLGLEYLSLGLTNLVSLDLSMCLSVTDEGLGHIAKIASLKKLMLLGCEDLTGQGMFHLATAQFRLNYLIISYCNQIEDTGIYMLNRGQGLLNLTTLNINACPITDIGLSVVAERLRDLVTLNISECEFISKDGISVVASNLRKLRSINMRLCTGLTNISLKHLARMPSLEVINLKGCTKITGRGMSFIVPCQGQSNVLELDVSFTTIGDSGLRYIAQGMQQLRSLNLCGCTISDKGLARIARSLHALHTLRISRCSRITDNGIKVVACNLKSLRQIDLKGCSRITSAGKRCLVVRLPHLKFL